jgi:GNAT superfamily N-acetyltransferase
MDNRFVRAARAEDAAAVGRVQSASYHARYAGLVPRDTLEGMTPEVLASGWEHAVVHPPSPAHRVLVAVGGPGPAEDVSGFAACGPAGDPDVAGTDCGELYVLVVGPDHLGEGHGSRLLQAAVEHLASDGFTTAVTWIPEADDAQRSFLEGAGWGPDGARRELLPATAGEPGPDGPEAASGPVTMLRLHTFIGDRGGHDHA